MKTNARAFSSRPKAEAKPQRRNLASPSTRTLPIRERKWTDVEPEDYSPVDYQESKQLTLLRHGHLPREDDGAIEFWRLKDFLWNDFVRSQHWSDNMWKGTMAKGGGNKKRFQCCTDPSGQEILSPSSSRSFRTQSHCCFITGQCINSERFLRVRLSHRMCNQFTFHHEFRIDTGRTKFEQKTDGFLHVSGSYEQRTQRSEYNWPGSTASCMVPSEKWKKHQNTMYWVDIKLAQKKGFKFYQTRSNAIILYDTFPAYCIPKAIMMETGDIIFEKVFASPQPAPKISFKDNWMKELGSEVAGGSEDSQQTQPKTKNPIVRTVRPVKSEQNVRTG